MKLRTTGGLLGNAHGLRYVRALGVHKISQWVMALSHVGEWARCRVENFLSGLGVKNG